ncbi:uncharacterized protein LOC131948908 [Physella acuta]|uniref:uncharacterized protein LOC131948908 n=1 Tax=Physella acuta TaxID=109671 RepID=UPI0027DC813E|nr:uncharacterized protein LOC131948908 [Physella acuta]
MAYVMRLKVFLFILSAMAEGTTHPPPVIAVDGQSLTDGDEFTLPYTSSTNETLARVECREPRATDLATGVELVCRGLKVPGDEQRVFLVPYNKYSDKILCTCYLRFASAANNINITFLLNIAYVPEQDPVVTIAGQIIDRGSTYSHQANKYITNIRCNVPDGNPPISNYTITCSTSNGYKSSTLEPDDDLMLDVQGQGHGNCTCRPNHVTGLYNRTTSFYIEYNVQPYVPQTAPIISVGERVLSEGEIVTVGAELTISCAVLDGYPRVEQVTFQCGPYTRTVLNYTGDFTIPYNKVYNQQTCVCTATHVTGQYQRNSTILLDVHYAPVVTRFTANGVQGFLNVTKQRQVEMVCEADGNPPPYVFMQYVNSAVNPFGDNELVSVKYVKRIFTATSNYYGFYYCQVFNYYNYTSGYDSRMSEVGVVKTSFPLIATYTANGNTSLLNINRDTIVTFRCELISDYVNYNVWWSITARTGYCSHLLHQTPEHTNTSTVKTYTLLASCGCSDTYECIAHISTTNGTTSRLLTSDVRSIDIQSIVVNVNCPGSPLIVTVYNNVVSDGQRVQLHPLYTSVDIQCTAQGDRQMVSKVTLKCGDTIQTKNGYNGLFTIQYNKSMNEQGCVCSASHVTVSFDTSFVLSISQTTPIIAKFTANGQSAFVKVKSNGPIKFECSTFDNITNTAWNLQAKTSGKTLYSGSCPSAARSFEITTAAECGKTETYECTATLANMLSDTRTLQVDAVCNTGGVAVPRNILLVTSLVLGWTVLLWCTA